MKDIIQIKDISFNYSGQPLLFDHLSLNIHEGEWTALIGQNGSGKSTLARLIDGLIVLKSGQIVVDDLTVNDQNIFDVRSKIGMVFQNPEDQFVGATVEDDVAFGLENRRVPRDRMHEIVEKSLKDVGMWEFRDRIPANLSGGQKQRVAIAGIVALSPKIIILDEATSMLDPRGRQDILNLVARIKAANNLTVISITHDIDEAAHADQVVVVNKGEIIEENKPENIFGETAKLQSLGLSAPFTAQLIAALKQHGIDPNSQYMNDERLIAWIKKFVSQK
ncbi:Energy-coupling factor transporter ATP-binding protein EcfA1 [Lentilactobacillus parabuchneri]|jgi:energy-coupling factor transport system ATP-binding protein|uniref:Energy-coupling factor transporter ATP-binding protein EcfA1 n=4 Tax=Lentilactobacillus parabuchneri TaxID=152331 RepID=A0A1X1FDK1_9LACO|nr:energy-coupling factor transporter ATPase [Lentilactobacillus parabuchneri]APR07894.1 Energy-coupling factor transporter ATP-binding protein EcfA1 [Lentilactobacillus parabuchneri]KRM47135.1 polyamine-transporting ATPase [Lentilactobacillus parabuchneri DSM 5707 = NBRC 107865]KRN70896.1 polyamine-transporting ATPase [Lentilactobacillus parabuchneri]MBW0222134.1 energy-coupling factor transporter ATPase [Lentilactobacillus parabuchneri]MBW0245629.1 energy-coupling factor transporter ATPase [